MSDDTPTTDEQLWDAYVEGNDEALEGLVRRHNDDLFWYMLLSTGRQRSAAQHLFRVWDLIARWRRPHEGFGSFRAWLYAVATQNAVPAGHPEGMGLTELLDDLGRGAPVSRSAEVFFRVGDLRRHLRQPFLLVTVAGLGVADAARACNFTEERTARFVAAAYRRLAASRLFKLPKGSDEV